MDNNGYYLFAISSFNIDMLLEFPRSEEEINKMGRYILESSFARGAGSNVCSICCRYSFDFHGGCCCLHYVLYIINLFFVILTWADIDFLDYFNLLAGRILYVICYYYFVTKIYYLVAQETGYSSRAVYDTVLWCPYSNTVSYCNVQRVPWNFPNKANLLCIYSFLLKFSILFHF